MTGLARHPLWVFVPLLERLLTGERLDLVGIERSNGSSDMVGIDARRASARPTRERLAFCGKEKRDIPDATASPPA